MRRYFLSRITTAVCRTFDSTSSHHGSFEPSEDVKKELLEKDGVSVKEEVDDDFFNELIEEDKPDEDKPMEEQK